MTNKIDIEACREMAEQRAEEIQHKADERLTAARAKVAQDLRALFYRGFNGDVHVKIPFASFAMDSTLSDAALNTLMENTGAQVLLSRVLAGDAVLPLLREAIVVHHISEFRDYLAAELLASHADHEGAEID